MYREIERMIKEAEQFKKEDSEMREAMVAKNTLEVHIYVHTYIHMYTYKYIYIQRGKHGETCVYI